MLLLLCLTVAVALASTEAYTSQQANKYIDFVLREQFVEEAEYSRLDPYKLPDIHTDLISLTIVDNKAELTKGQLFKLSTIERDGDCSAPSWQSANISFTCKLRFENLVINYTANVTYDNMQIVFYPTTSVKGTEVSIQITTSREENIPSLRMFFINDIGHMTVTAKMISIGDVSQKVGPPVREAIVKESTTNLHKALNGRLKDALGFSIYKTPIPFVG